MREPAPLIILVAADTNADLAQLAQILRDAQFEVHVGHTGAEALRLVAADPHLLILAPGLPDMSGSELCRRLKQDAGKAHLPVLALVPDEHAERPEEADGFLPLPVLPTALLALVRTLLHTRQVEQRSSTAIRQWTALFDAISDGAALLDHDGRFLRCNQILADVVQRPVSDILGRYYHEVVPPPLATGPGRPFPRMLRSRRRETAELALDGRWWRVTADPVFDDEGQLTEAVYILADITEQMLDRQRIEELAAQAEAKSRELEDANRRKDEFLALLAHELRNPLAPLLNALHLWRLHDKHATMSQARDLAERQVRHLARLVDDLLDVSRIARGKIQLKKERVDVRQIVGQAVEMARPQIEARQHRLTVLLPPEPVQLDADPARLVQIVVNLLTNAAKYTPPGGQMWVTAEGGEEEVLLKVRDTGVGLTAEMLPWVFDLFVQAEPGSQGGLGIGLAMVRGLVELHGGSVVAFSDGPGEGSEFVVRLPAPPARLAQMPLPAPTATAGGGPALRVLVVDDDIDGAQSVALLLAAWGHDVRVAHDGITALETARGFQPRVILLDIGLPGGVDGHEVARRLRGEGLREVVIVALTGFGQEDDRRRSLEAGCNHHLVKPVAPSALEALLAHSPEQDGKEELRAS